MTAKKQQSKEAVEAPLKEEATEPRVYEVGYLLLSSITSEQATETVDQMKQSIKELEGTLITEAEPKLIELAYTMELRAESKRDKHTHGYFGWIKFEARPEATEELQERIKANGNVIRFICVKTVREDTFSSNKLKTEDDDGEEQKQTPKNDTAKKETKEPKKPISDKDEAEIDKSIEELVTE